MARHCPECSDPLSASGVCGSCGYGKTNAKGKTFDPGWWRCTETQQGRRCSKVGGMSHSTHGGGPWYCREHFEGASRPVGSIAPPRGFTALQSLMPNDPCAEAER